MREVFIVHGGNCFQTQEEYLDYLREKPVDLSDGQYSDWKSTLMSELGEGFNVTQPRFPNSQNARYEEWKIMFDKYVPLLPEQTILIGHSLGGSFLAKYLSETSLQADILATILISPPFDIDGDRALVEFVPSKSLKLLHEQGGQIHLFHSKDDTVVLFSELEKYKTGLPEAVPHVFEDRGHFNGPEFPELVELIQSMRG